MSSVGKAKPQHKAQRRRKTPKSFEVIVESRASHKHSHDKQAGTAVYLSDDDHALKLFLTSPYDRVNIVRSGLPAKYVKVLSADMCMSIEKFYRTTGLARPTIDRKIRDSKRLNSDESERVMGIARLIGQAKNMVRESGGLDAFDAGRWVGEWLQMPLPALGDTPPGEFMDTVDGRALVSDLLAQQQSGAYG